MLCSVGLVFLFGFARGSVSLLFLFLLGGERKRKVGVFWGG